MTHKHIARVCHEANRAYCEAIGDTSQKSWNEAEEWQRESASQGVIYALNHPEVTPEEMHTAWMADKLAAGWVYGPTKNAETKEHPCIIPYDGLPPEQKAKDKLFAAIVAALKD